MEDSRRVSIADVETTAASVQIQQGTCYAIFAYDIALAINLNEAERLLNTDQRAHVNSNGKISITVVIEGK